jgi:hypothetical protein
MAELENIDEFNKMISDLDNEIKKEVMKKGFSAAVKPLIEQAKANIPNNSRIQKSLGSKYDPSSNSAEVGARKGKHYAGFLAPWFEEGTKPRETKTRRKIKGHSTGQITGTHFWQNALNDKEQEVFNGLFKALIDSYNKVIKKYEKFYSK